EVLPVCVRRSRLPSRPRALRYVLLLASPVRGSVSWLPASLLGPASVPELAVKPAPSCCRRLPGQTWPGEQRLWHDTRYLACSCVTSLVSGCEVSGTPC